MWTVEHEPDVDNLEEALDYAWDNADGDSAKYQDRIEELSTIAAGLGFSPLGRAWEYEWLDELEPLWRAVCAVAALLMDCQSVTHDQVLAAIKSVGPLQ
jgi:hypothetical protein